ncbi:MAG: D-tyrosyl-tRNA(Tyr) deacylase [Candidatus Omnitrophica bacterium]|nr:D-tyrosyl-tRNA(Tyr) deacylase [Candidatus Omnitrophota bacterium]
MLAVIQRVNTASVAVKEKVVAEIDKGLLVFLGVAKGDTSLEAKYLAGKIIELRIFGDQNRKMNLSAKEVAAELLVVSQFTLCGKLTKGRRPSFDRAADPETAQRLYLEFIQYLKESQLTVKQGIFKEYMDVHIENDGPVTFILDSKEG